MSKSTTRPTRRRWFQFGLGTLFLLFTALAVFIGYHVNWIRQRHSALTGFSAQAGMEIAIRRLSNEGIIAYVVESNPMFYKAAPFALRLFGESGVWRIDVSTFYDDWQEQIAQAKRLFPEAIVRPRVFDPGSISPEWPEGMERFEENRTRRLKSLAR